MEERCVDGWDVGVNNCLTPYQINFFKNSRFKGIHFYHGSNATDIEVFDCDTRKCFFSLSKDYATEMINQDYDTQKVYDVYLNIARPFNLSTRKQIKIFNEEYLPWVRSQKNLVFQPRVKILGDTLDINNADWIYEFLKMNYNKYKFDGLIVDEGIKRGKYGGICSYVPFFSNQIKSVTNFKPSKNGSINR